MLELESGPHPISDRDGRTYRLPFPSSKNLEVISRRSRAQKAKKCYSTKKRYARAELLFC